MPTKYKLTYFNGRGRAELSRMLFNVAGVAYDDVRIEFPEWSQLKAETPQGSLPVLEIDGKQKICQSFAIARYLARKFNLYGKTNDDMAIVDQICDTLLDVFTPYVKMAFTTDGVEKDKMKEDFETKTLPAGLDNLNKLVLKARENGFAVGKSLTMADLALYVYLENCNVHDKVPKDKYPNLTANLASTAKHPKVAAYLKTRANTDF